MRLVHTADWHLGRLFHGVHLTDDQAHVLDQLVELVADVRPHAVLIAGDVYDRAVPPPEAVRLLDDVLTRLALEQRTPVVMIAGNHDSADRLGFGARLMAARGVHVLGSVGPRPDQVVLEDEHGTVAVAGLPYAEPALVRERTGDDGARDHDEAMRVLTDRAREAVTGHRRSVLLAHAFVAGGSESDSERPLAVGGSAAVSPARFEGFTYTALGHLHRPQTAGSERIQYAGSLLKYSFSEADHRKSVSVVDVDAAGGCTVERVALTPRRDVRVIEGSLSEILAGPAGGESRDDYVMARLTDKGAILDAMGRIRDVYPNCLHVDRSAFFATGTAGESRRAIDRRGKDEQDLFREFFEEVVGEDASDDESAVFAEIVAGLRRRQRGETS